MRYLKRFTRKNLVWMICVKDDIVKFIETCGEKAVKYF